MLELAAVRELDGVVLSSTIQTRAPLHGDEVAAPSRRVERDLEPSAIRSGGETPVRVLRRALEAWQCQRGDDDRHDGDDDAESEPVYGANPSQRRKIRFSPVLVAAVTAFFHAAFRVDASTVTVVS